MKRVADVIEGYVREMTAHGVESHMAIATSASRDAANGDEFISLLQSSGVTPHIISGTREAALSFAGATFGIEGQGLLVVDLGGGSTELVLGDSSAQGSRVHYARSLDIGSRRITEMFLSSDPPQAQELQRARESITAELAVYFDDLPQHPRQMISVAGTATTLAAILMEMERYDAGRIHGSTLDGSELQDLLGRLGGVPLEERKEIAGLHPGRAPVIVAGALILACVLEASGLELTTVSDHDILYGILLDIHARGAEEGR
jgi:exopolyphosphatase/guanosine-5'-triphosphate,3'-diphosphate pyrophosphatase